MRKPEGRRGASSGNISSIGAKTSSEQAPTAFSSTPLHSYRREDVSLSQYTLQRCLKSHVTISILQYLQEMDVPRHKSIFLTKRMTFESDHFKHLGHNTKEIIYITIYVWYVREKIILTFNNVAFKHKLEVRCLYIELNKFLRKETFFSRKFTRSCSKYTH